MGTQSEHQQYVWVHLCTREGSFLLFPQLLCQGWASVGRIFHDLWGEPEKGGAPQTSSCFGEGEALQLLWRSARGSGARGLRLAWVCCAA